MVGKVCLFNKCHGPPKWKHYGIATKEAVTYSKLLGQKRGFKEFIEFNDMQISKSGKMDSYCIVDKRYSPSKGSNIDIFICDEDHHGVLYLEYSVHKQYIIKNCNDLITFLNLNKNSTFHLHDSFIYVKSDNRFKWVLFFRVLEFLIKNLNMSIIGSQFYFPLFSKYLIMNELRLLFALQNWLKNLSENFIKTFSQTCETSTLSLKKGLPSGAPHLVSRLQYPKNNISFPSEQAIRKMNLNTDTCKSIQKLQLKRKSVDSYTGDYCLPKTKRLNSEKNVCHCKNYTWKIFIPFQKTSVLNYTSILEAKNWVDDPEAMHVFPVDRGFQTDCLQNSNSSVLHQNQNMLNQDNFSSINTSEKSSPVQLLHKASELKSIADLSSEETKENHPKHEQISDLQTLKETESASDDKENFTLDDFDHFQLSALECEKEECKNEQIYPRATTADESQKNIAGPSGGNPSKPSFIGIDKLSVTFQTASGKSLKISEAALQAAKKMFEDISSESLDIFPEKKTQNSLQLKSVLNDKHCVGFQTASGKSLHASKTALEAAEKMFKEINVEEIDVFPEKQAQTKQNNKECYPSLKDCADDDISKVLAENFFEDIPFDEKEIDSKPIDDSTALSVQKPEITKAHKIRKSLGGRRSLKPYSLKK
ncbi:hypothetical protein AVEN_181603-1 [Araneus ventricosus]|uniref:Breast cancer type 2 susceptibility n=1 Tax=Araneus ventricosus TaxID=182803 RepID=A0A4Y2CNC7_ARAVE|nr:hypothetical protein AVEN_181603-1 [Araneus ventricosus]